MKFEISFDEKIFRQQIELTFDTSWKKYKTDTNRLAIIAAICTVISALILFGKSNGYGNLFIMITIITVIIFVTREYKYKIYKKATNKIADETVKKFNENPVSTWEFVDDYFRFAYYGGDYKIYWNNFKYINVIDNTLMFGYSKSDNSYTLSESEIGKDDFLKIVDFVESKIKTNC